MKRGHVRSRDRGLKYSTIGRMPVMRGMRNPTTRPVPSISRSSGQARLRALFPEGILRRISQHDSDLPNTAGDGFVPDLGDQGILVGQCKNPRFTSFGQEMLDGKLQPGSVRLALNAHRSNPFPPQKLFPIPYFAGGLDDAARSAPLHKARNKLTSSSVRWATRSDRSHASSS